MRRAATIFGFMAATGLLLGSLTTGALPTSGPADNHCLNELIKQDELLCSPFGFGAGCSSLALVATSFGPFPNPSGFTFVSHAFAGADAGRPVDTDWDTAATGWLGPGPNPIIIYGVGNVDCYAEARSEPRKGFAEGSARIDHLMIGLPGAFLDIRQLEGRSRVDNQCDDVGRNQTASVGSITLNGVPLVSGTVAPNTRIDVPFFGYIVLNEQTAIGTNPASGNCGLHTAAFRLLGEFMGSKMNVIAGWSHVEVAPT